jgi:hypothetical protein
MTIEIANPQKEQDPFTKSTLVIKSATLPFRLLYIFGRKSSSTSAAVAKKLKLEFIPFLSRGVVEKRIITNLKSLHSKKYSRTF